MGETYDRSRRWFLKKVGVASGIASAGLGVMQIGCGSDDGNHSSNIIQGSDGEDAGTTIPEGDTTSGASGSDTSNPVDTTSGGEEDTLVQVDAGESGDTSEEVVTGEDAQAEEDTTESLDATQDDDTSDPDTLVEVDAVQTETDGGGTTEICEVTGSDAKGPFYEEGAPFTNQLADADEIGVRIRIEGTVFEPDCTTPIPGALLDIWQADNEGEYHSAEEEYRLRGQILADEQGGYAFESILPGRYAMSGSFRPAHIHFTVSKPGFTSVTTQMYFEGDPYLAPNDPCGGCNSGDLTQIIPMEPGEGDIEQAGVFDIVLAKG